MHRIIVGDVSFESALDALHTRSTTFGRYHDTFNTIPQQNRFSEVCFTGHYRVTYCRSIFAVD